VAVIGAAALPAPRLVAAVDAAIALPAITGNTNEKHGLALCLEAHSLPENYGFLGRRHALSQTGLDSGTCFMAG